MTRQPSEAADASSFDRVAYRLILDDEQVWAEIDPVTADATELGIPTDHVIDAAPPRDLHPRTVT